MFLRSSDEHRPVSNTISTDFEKVGYLIGLRQRAVGGVHLHLQNIKDLGLQSLVAVTIKATHALPMLDKQHCVMDCLHR